jgi:hypothetical protein
MRGVGNQNCYNNCIYFYKNAIFSLCGFNVKDVVQEKIAKNNEKYPVDKAKGSAKKYDEL